MEGEAKISRKIWIGIISLAALLVLIAFSTTQTKKINLDKLPGIALAAPGPEVTDPDFGAPLNTSNIALFAYYYEPSGWILNQTVPAFLNYTDHGNYYDGWVRVWDSGFIGSSSNVAGDTYIDIYVRVRGDGWIMAWMDRSQDRGEAIWWGQEVYYKTSAYATNPTSYALTPGRAIYQVYYVAGKTFPGYENIRYYDYELNTATRLFVFGYVKQLHCDRVSITDDHTYKFTIPDTISTKKALLVYAYADKIEDSYYCNENRGQCFTQFDGTTVYNTEWDCEIEKTNGFVSYELTLTSGYTYTVRVYTRCYSGSAGTESWQNHWSAVIIWA